MNDFESHSKRSDRFVGACPRTSVQIIPGLGVGHRKKIKRKEEQKPIREVDDYNMKGA
ncbi:hypothetical protein PISMIDRAFT_676501 [Pisolithus microcarpus 441]|uniref:Uncharacterized protein n=1 Tax=Pisolithus microcarpus 441 TaxID=765257 RepID=A0A0C9ZJ53_9AGAM|nr:hypothetical protein PISMIDRAFT_676501 [Pisolithus microcarpus 441]